MSGVSVRVRVTPRGGRDAIIGVRPDDSVLLLRVAAPPVDGAANKACIALLAEALGVRRGDITLVSGQTSRDKRFAVATLTGEELRQRLSQLSQASGGASGGL
jgi:uncharacterized protein